jgi:hypothetical protein
MRAPPAWLACAHLSTNIVPVEGLIGKEAKTVLKVLAARTATKAGKTYSNAMGYMRARLSIVIVRATPCMHQRPHSPDIANEKQTSTLGGYGRDGPPQIIIKRRL